MSPSEVSSVTAESASLVAAQAGRSYKHDTWLGRAFLKDAPILILDEPTSSLDSATEALIMDAMERLMRGRTTVMIAHRLSTFDYCDARISLEGGRATPLRTAAYVSDGYASFTG
jgi:ABC-type transport system involved in cytochrome bd biosynthesis fused ATPase/permease subunit